MGSKDDLLSLFMNCKVTPSPPAPASPPDAIVVSRGRIIFMTLVWAPILSSHHHCLAISSNHTTQDDDGVPFSAPKHRKNLRSVCASVVCGDKRYQGASIMMIIIRFFSPHSHIFAFFNERILLSSTVMLRATHQTHPPRSRRDIMTNFVIAGRDTTACLVSCRGRALSFHVCLQLLAWVEKLAMPVWG